MNIELCLVERQSHGFVAHIGDTQLVLRVLQLDRVVNTDIGHGRSHDTIGSVQLYYIGHQHGTELIGHGTADDVACLLGKGTED